MQCNAINAFLDYHHTIINLNYLNEELIIFIYSNKKQLYKKVIISFLFFFFLFPYYYIRSGGGCLSFFFFLLLPFKKLNWIELNWHSTPFWHIELNWHSTPFWHIEFVSIVLYKNIHTINEQTIHPTFVSCLLPEEGTERTNETEYN